MKNSLANIDKRQRQILSFLQEKQQLTTFELAEKLSVSLSTIRRDLNILEEKNEIIRKFGYCVINEQNHTDFDHSGPEFIKQSIARIASKYVSDYDTLFINSSSTALYTVNYLTAKQLTVVTNNLKIAQTPHNATYTYILTGGELRIPKEVLIGDIAIDTISSMNADVCIIGCSGISLENGVTTKIFNEAKINELMIKQTFKHKILVADHRKLNVTSKFKIADISIFDYLITDKYCPPAIIDKLQAIGVEVIQAL